MLPLKFCNFDSGQKTRMIGLSGAGGEKLDENRSRLDIVRACDNETDGPLHYVMWPYSNGRININFPENL